MSLILISVLTKKKVHFKKRVMYDVRPAATDTDSGELTEGRSETNTESACDIDP